MYSTIVSVSSKSLQESKYVPPPIGNGMLSLQIDEEGTQLQRERCGMTPGIFLAGLRTDVPGHPLVKLGWFDQDLEGSGRMTEFHQSLDRASGLVKVVTKYENAVLYTEFICSLRRNIIGIRKRIVSRHPTLFFFALRFPAQRRVLFTSCGQKKMRYEVDSRIPCSGFFEAASEIPLLEEPDVLGIRTTVPEFELFFGVDRNPEGESFESILAENKADFADYYKECIIEIPMEFHKTAMTAQYHLKINSTPYGMPIGLFPSHWEGRYFGYDELYMGGGLLAAGHLNEVRKIVDFRYRTLAAAKKNVLNCKCCGRDYGVARYVWESLEDGTEGAPPGCWCDHIFQMANIALLAKRYCDAARDPEFFRDRAYPVIRACAEYFRIAALYETPRGLIIGKCTDLERLGPHVENAFMTSCGAIATFESAADAAKQLETDLQLAEHWRKAAFELRKTLPDDTQKYRPLRDREEHSIASFGGWVPYGILADDDPKQIAAVLDAWEHRDEFALQYERGDRLTPWYASVIAMAFCRLGRHDFATSLLHKAQEDCGVFGELFEIPGKNMRPYFATAEGAFLQALYAIESKKNY